MKLTNRLALELAEALKRLDGSEKEAYVFSGKTRYALSKNLRLLMQRAADIDRSRVKLVRELAPAGAPLEPGSEDMARFRRGYDALLDTADELPGLLQFSWADLDVDRNQIPITVLAALGPLLREQEAA